MTAQLRSELLKLRSTRTTMVLLLTAVALVVLGAVALGTSLKLEELVGEDKQRELFGSATGVILLATYVGVIGLTSEFRYGTIHPTLLIEPRRRVVLGAKLAASALVGLVFGVVGVAAGFGASGVILVARDVDFAISGGHATALVGGTIAGTALCAMLGVAVGALIRNQVGALIALGAWALAVETVLFVAVPSVGRYLPGLASSAFAGLPDPNHLSSAVGGTVLLAWTMRLRSSQAYERSAATSRSPPPGRNRSGMRG